MNAELVNVIDHIALTQLLLEILAAHRLAKSNEYLGVGICTDHVPKLALGFSSQSAGDILRRMHLQRQLLPSIENFDEQRKSLSIPDVPKNFLPMGRPQFVQRSPA